MNDNKMNAAKKGFVYVLTDGSSDRYKIGCTTQSQVNLVKRYLTQVPQVDILVYCETPDFRSMEAHLLNILSDFRVINAAGNKSEWVEVSYDRILREIQNYKKQCKSTVLHNPALWKHRKKRRKMDELRDHHCHKMEARPFVCDKCDASFTENYRLTRHRRTCKGAKPCPICPTCGKIFQFPSKLKEHGNGKRCKPDDHKVKETTCHDCGKEFPTPSKLQSHRKHSPGSCERHRRSQNPSASVCEECRKADFPSKMHVPGGKACKEYAKQNAEKTEKEE